MVDRLKRGEGLNPDLQRCGGILSATPAPTAETFEAASPAGRTRSPTSTTTLTTLSGAGSSTPWTFRPSPQVLSHPLSERRSTLDGGHHHPERRAGRNFPVPGLLGRYGRTAGAIPGVCSPPQSAGAKGEERGRGFQELLRQPGLLLRGAGQVATGVSGHQDGEEGVSGRLVTIFVGDRRLHMRWGVFQRG